jgi:hypothetical protein
MFVLSAPTHLANQLRPTSRIRQIGSSRQSGLGCDLELARSLPALVARNAVDSDVVFAAVVPLAMPVNRFVNCRRGRKEAATGAFGSQMTSLRVVRVGEPLRFHLSWSDA